MQVFVVGDEFVDPAYGFSGIGVVAIRILFDFNAGLEGGDEEFQIFLLVWIWVSAVEVKHDFAPIFGLDFDCAGAGIVALPVNLTDFPHSQCHIQKLFILVASDAHAVESAALVQLTENHVAFLRHPHDSLHYSQRINK